MNPQPHRRNALSFLISALALSLFTLAALVLAYRATAQAADSTLYLPLAVSNRTFDVTPVGRGFYVAMGITHAGDERIFVAERGGRIQLLQPDGRETTFLDLSAKVVSSPGEYGLYDIAFHPGYGDPTSPGKNPNLGALTQAPYYAVRLYPGDIGASTGLATNGHAQVLGDNDQPIAGLYAVGNDMHSIMGGVYTAPGITIGPGLVFAYLAVQHATAANRT